LEIAMTASAPHRSYDVLGQLLRFHAFPGEVSGKYCLVETIVPPGLGAPPNHHAGETEAFYVLDGEVEFMVDGQTRRVGAGGFVAIPDGAVHAFSAVGARPARLLILNAPGEMHAAFFTKVGREVPDDTPAPHPPQGPPDLAAIGAAAAAVGMTLMAPEGVPG
jgi:quercetin dioxygenase-like cupin family protein